MRGAMTSAEKVPTVALTGDVAMPLIGFGTWQLRGRRAYDATRYALEAGYRHLDTATMYGNEAEIGRAVRDSGLDRREVFITTKLPPRGADHERETIDASLRAMGTAYVDLWLVARAVGVSNYSLGQLDELIDATGEAPAVNQIPWSPTRHDRGELAGNRDRGVVVEGYSPLKGANLRDPVLAEIAARHGVTPAQVVLRWHLEHGIVVIPKSGHRDRIAANFDLHGFRLDADEVARIDGLSRLAP